MYRYSDNQLVSSYHTTQQFHSCIFIPDTENLGLHTNQYMNILSNVICNSYKLENTGALLKDFHSDSYVHALSLGFSRGTVTQEATKNHTEEVELHGFRVRAGGITTIATVLSPPPTWPNVDLHFSSTCSTLKLPTTMPHSTLTPTNNFSAAGIQPWPSP